MDAIVLCTAMFDRQCPACAFRASTVGSRVLGLTHARTAIPDGQTPADVAMRLALYLTDHWMAAHYQGGAAHV